MEGESELGVGVEGGGVGWGGRTNGTYNGKFVCASSVFLVC